MATQKRVAVKEFCLHHNIAIDFIDELHHNDVIQLVMVKRSRYIPAKNLHSLEKIVRLYNDLNINFEGIQTILHLLSTLEKKEVELTDLRNRLAFYTED